MRVRGFQEERIGFQWPPLTAWVKVLLIFYASVFVVELVLYKTNTLDALNLRLGFIPTAITQSPWEFYRFFTFLLIPRFDILDLVLTLLTIYMFGGLLEDSIGSKRFGFLFIASGIFAALGYFLISGFQGQGLLLGPTTSCLGLLACSAVLYPNRQMVFILFLVPLWLIAAITTAFIGFNLFTSGNPTAWAYLLGLAGGALYAWNLKAITPLWQKIWPKKLVARWKKKQEQKIQRKQQDEQKEMDRILEKIGREGIHSISPSEKKFLDRTSEKLRHRS